MPLTRFEDDHDHELDEVAPFLPESDQEESLPRSKLKRTPLPIAQISILLTAWFAESIISQSINPYINQVQYAI